MMDLVRDRALGKMVDRRTGTSLVNVQFTRKLSDPGVRLYNGTCMLHCVLSSATTATFFNGEVVIQEK